MGYFGTRKKWCYFEPMVTVLLGMQKDPGSIYEENFDSCVLEICIWNIGAFHIFPLMFLFCNLGRSMDRTPIKSDLTQIECMTQLNSLIRFFLSLSCQPS